MGRYSPLVTGGTTEYVNVGDDVDGDRLCWTRVDAAGRKTFVVFIRMGGEDEIRVEQLRESDFGICMTRPSGGWHDAGELVRAYDLALRWARE